MPNFSNNDDPRVNSYKNEKSSSSVVFRHSENNDNSCVVIASSCAYEEKARNAPAVSWKTPKPFFVRVTTSRNLCVLCNVAIADRTGYMDAHTTGMRHSCALDDYGFNVAPTENGRYSCRTCDVEINDWDAISSHVRREDHRRARRDDDLARLSRPASWDSDAGPFAKRIDSRRFYCALCDYEAACLEEFLSHAVGQEHTSALLLNEPHVKPLQEDFFHCALCDVVLPRAEVLRVHLAGRRHCRALRVDWTTHSSFVAPFVRRDDDQYRCLLCSCMVELDDEALERHRADDSHVRAMRLDEENITPLRDGRYSCNLCRRRLCDWRNIPLHLRGPRHKRALNQSRGNRAYGRVGDDSQRDEKTTPYGGKFYTERASSHAAPAGDAKNHGGEKNDEKKRGARGWKGRSAAAQVLEGFDESLLDFENDGRSSMCEGEEREMKMRARAIEIQERAKESEERPKEIHERSNQMQEKSVEIRERTMQNWEKPKEFSDREKQNWEKPSELEERPMELQERPTQRQEGAKKIQKRSKELQELQKRPKDLQELQERPKDLQKLQERPKDLQELQERPKDLQELQKGPKDLQKLQERPKDLQELQKRSKDLQKLQERPKDFQKLQESSKDLQEIQKRPKDLQEIQERPKDLQKLQERPKDLQELQERPKDLQELQKRSKDLQKLQERPKDLQKLQESSKDLQELQKRPKDLQELQERPKDLQELQERPKDLQKLQESSKDLQKLQESSKDLQKLQERPKDLQELQKRPKDLQELQKRPKDLQELQKRPKDLQELQVSSEDLQELQKRLKDLQELQERPKDLQELQERSKDLQELQERPKDLQELQKRPKGLQELQKRPKDLQELQKRPKDLQELQKRPKDLQELQKRPKDLQELQKRPKDLQQLDERSTNTRRSTVSTLRQEPKSSQRLDLPTILSLMNEELSTLLEDLRLEDAATIESDPSGVELKLPSHLSCDRSPSSRIENLQSLSRCLSSGAITCRRPSEFESTECRNARRPCNAYLEKISILLNFDEDIYDTSLTTNKTLLSFDLRFAINSSVDYCLVCRKMFANDLEKFLAHSWTREHLEALDNMENEDSKIRGNPRTFSALSLAREYVELLSSENARCLVCRVTLNGHYDDIARHLDEREHCATRARARARTRENFEILATRLKCDWYKVQKYECLVCTIKFDSELDFVEHLIESAQHTREFSTNGETKLYAFCSVCALIYCARATATNNHHETLAHKWFVRNGPFVIDRLPVAAELLLSSLEDYEDFKMDELIEEIENSCRNSIVNAHERGTGYDIRSNFDVEAPLENVKFIRFFDKIFPPGAKILSFLKLWLTGCDLSGIQGISSVALYWYFVLYLQTLSILPSVASLSSMKTFWHSLADWEDIARLETKSNTDLRHHLVGFFALYANFDYRYDVACPLLGKVIEKRAFADDARYLPEEMRSYVAYMTCYEYPEPFRIDASMCLQDPLDLQNNITKSVTKVDLSRFRIFCSKSLSVLFPPEM